MTRSPILAASVRYWRWYGALPVEWGNQMTRNRRSWFVFGGCYRHGLPADLPTFYGPFYHLCPVCGNYVVECVAETTAREIRPDYGLHDYLLNPTVFRSTSCGCVWTGIFTLDFVALTVTWSDVSGGRKAPDAPWRTRRSARPRRPGAVV